MFLGHECSTTAAKLALPHAVERQSGNVRTHLWTWFTDAAGWLWGEEGRGIQVIIKMVNATRLDVTNWAVALMRQSVSRQLVSCNGRHRAKLIDKPLMQNVVADLEVETEVGTMMGYDWPGPT